MFDTSFSGPARRCWARTLAALLPVALVLLPVALSAEVLELNPVADTSLVEVFPGNNLGGADFLNSGTAGNHRTSRGLMRFDVGALPAGALVTSAVLVLDVTREPQDGLVGSTYGLHRVLRDWGEGTGTPTPSHPGTGVPALPGEATWSHRFFGTSLTWGQPGGQTGVDYLGGPSSEVGVLGINDSPYTFPVTPELLGDLDFWRTHPNENFGWMLISQGEGLQYTARSFSSREGISPAVLRISFNVPEPSSATLLAIGGAILLGGRRQRTATSRK